MTAIELADKLKKYSLTSGYAWYCHKAADEIRRQHEAILKLRVALGAIYYATEWGGDLDSAKDDAEKDAARYRWLKANHQAWSWQPSRYNSEITSGFAHNNTGYSGFAFEDALVLAMKEQK